MSLVFLPAEAVAYGLAVHGLPLLGLSAVCFSLNIVFIGYFQSIEQSARSTVYTILRGAAFLVPAFILLPLVLGVDGLWLAIPAAEMLTLMVILVSSRQNLAVRDKMLNFAAENCGNPWRLLPLWIEYVGFSVLINITNQQMNYYETVFILTPVLSDDQMKEAVEKFKGILAENGAELVNEELWGLRKLAYPIQKKSTGFYCLFEFKAEPDFMKKLETDFRRDERVIRFLTFRLDKYAVEYAEKRRRVRASKASETSVEAVEVAEETVEAKEN